MTADQVADRVRRGLVNRVKPPFDRTYVRIVLEHAFPPVNIALYSIALVLLAMGLVIDALVTLGPIVGYVAVGIWQETRAKRQLDRIALLHRPRVQLRRDGREVEVDAGQIVLGDLVVLSRGDQVPVDGRIVTGELEADEALLTGESEPVARKSGDRVSSATIVVSGHAVAEADRIGPNSVASSLLASARAVRVERTPGQRVIQRVILVASAVVALTAALVAARLLGAPGTTWADAARAGAVLVALVPQGLLVVVTITYAIGAVRLARGGAVVQRIGAIESMSHVDTLCLDKTGTLTTGAIRLQSIEALDASEVHRLADVSASMEPPTGTLLALRAARPGVARRSLWQVPFSSARRWSAVALADDPGRCHLLGAADALDSSITDPARRASLASRVAELTARGNRVLLYATAASAAPPATTPASINPVALLIFTEQLRPDAATTIDGMRAAGMQLKIVSGDDRRTVRALALAAGIDADGDAAGNAATVERATLFGRIDPEGKADLVGQLRALGHRVAMVGDGVNDILGLKRADVGVALGSGSPATRAVADIVLLDDDLTLLPAILREGQRIASAMSVTLELLLARTTSMVVIVAVAALIGLPFPFTPRNNSLLALITVGIPTLVLALVVSPARPPTSLLRSALRFAMPSGVGMALAALAGYAIALASGAELALARTVVVDLGVIFGLGLLTLIARRWSRPRIRRADRWRPTILAVVMALIFLLTMAWPPTRGFFDLAPLPVPLLVTLGLIGIGWTLAAHLIAARLLPHVLHVAERQLDALAPKAAGADAR